MHENQPLCDGRLGEMIDAWALSVPIAFANRSRVPYIGKSVRKLTKQWDRTQIVPVASLASASGSASN